MTVADAVVFVKIIPFVASVSIGVNFKMAEYTR